MSSRTEASSSPSDVTHLPKGARRARIEYVAASLAEAPSIRYRYRLDGVDQGWIEAGRRREAVYTSLPPGIHRLEVVASNATGQWAETGDAFSLVVPRYLTETLPFRAALPLVAGALLFLGYRRRSAAHARHLAEVQAEVVRRREAEDRLRSLGQKLIRTQEDERHRLARELHDDVSQRLALLTVELDMMDAGSLDRLPELVEQARGVSTDIRQMSHALHPSALERLGLERALRTLVAEVERRSGMTVTFDRRGDVGETSRSGALCLYRVAQGALGNAAMHSGSTWASVTLSMDGDVLRLVVADGGRGFDVDAAESDGIGLVSMTERAGGEGGSLHVESSPGNGTTITCRIPAKPDAGYTDR